MYQYAKQLSQQPHNMRNTQVNINNHSQVTEHLGTTAKTTQRLASIDEHKISTSPSVSKSVTPSPSPSLSLSPSETKSSTISVYDTLIVTPTPSPSPSQSLSPPMTLLTQFIPNIPFNTPSLSNYNVSNVQWGLATNCIVYPNQPISPQPMLTNQLPFISNYNTTFHNITEHEITKTSIYIPRETIELINQYCIELFHTYQQNDMGLLFAHVKESNGMQINDKQIHIHNTFQGQIIITNIDLHFKNGNIMYLIGMANEIKFKERTPWKIVTIMSAETIYKQFGITQNKLPISCRNMKYFIDGLNVSPEYVSKNIISKTNFKKLCKKESKIKNKINTSAAVNISEHKLKYYCRKSWNNGQFLPVVVIKGGRQWIEWKKFIRIFDNKINGNEQWVGISLRYYSLNKKWQIECMDYDAGRVFYQFRLVADNHKYCYSYCDLKKLINTRLNIF